jgi:hypothetical protein
LRDRYPAATALSVMSSYEQLPTEKVLAISQSKGGLQLRFGGEDLAAMESEAREDCEKAFKEPCRVVLRNFEAVPWDDDAGAAPRRSPLPTAPRSSTTTKGVQ